MVPRPARRPGRLARPLSVLVLFAACSGASAPDPQASRPGVQLPEGHPLAELTFPLFEDFRDDCFELLDERASAGAPQTHLTERVDWAATLDEAFERATLEDKPVLIATFVRENGDPHCDV